MNVEYDDNDVKHSDGEEHHKQIKCPTGACIDSNQYKINVMETKVPLECPCGGVCVGAGVCKPFSLFQQSN